MSRAKMGEAELRVAVAKDVLKQVQAKKYVATKGVYINTKSFKPNCELQPQLISKKAPVCEVCGIGSAFLSLVRLDNAFKAQDEAGFVYENDMRDRLKKVFFVEQLWLIEDNFERQANEKDRKDLDINHDEDKPTDILIKIMKNIIKNKGTYKPRIK